MGKRWRDVEEERLPFRGTRELLALSLGLASLPFPTSCVVLLKMASCGS